MDTPEDSLDSLQQRWQAQDARLDEVLTLNRRILRTLESGRARTALDRAARTLWIQFFIDAIAVVSLGAFVGNRARDIVGGEDEWRYLLTSLVLLLPAIAIFASVIGQLVELHAIDISGPVTTIQNRLERLYTRRLRITKVGILIAPTLWLPIVIVMLRGLFGFDLFAWLPLWFLWLNVAVPIAFIPLWIWGTRWLLRHPKCSPYVQRYMRDLAGAGFREAEEQLARLAAFEREEGDESR